MTSATIAHNYKKNLMSWAEKTDKENVDFIEFQGHDFSMRGMDSVDATISSGLGHATSFLGSDSLPVIHGARKYYGEKGMVTAGVPATEHSVMCAGTKGDEIGTFRRLLNLYKDMPILSIVSDTWDLWKVITEYLPQLKEEILARDGKLVIRPDSGDPVDIICGKKTVVLSDWEFKTLFSKVSYQDYYNSDKPWGIPKYGKVSMYDSDIIVKNNNKCVLVKSFEECERSIRACEYVEVSLSESKGVIELLWDIFGGTINEQGYKVLDPHIGAIYGDSITLERADEICKRLEAKGFASTNIVLGIGSFTYQYNTRDTFGFAMKATYVEVESLHGARIEGREIFKDPITDDGTKKSAKGLLKVQEFDTDGINRYQLQDGCTWEQEGEGALQTIFEDGKFHNEITLTEIREKLNKFFA